MIDVSAEAGNMLGSMMIYFTGIVSTCCLGGYIRYTEGDYDNIFQRGKICDAFVMTPFKVGK
jgi:hypothetical protein